MVKGFSIADPPCVGLQSRPRPCEICGLYPSVAALTSGTRLRPGSRTKCQSQKLHDNHKVASVPYGSDICVEPRREGSKCLRRNTMQLPEKWPSPVFG